ncbi:MAG: C-GCAxxG-C-C family protein [Moorellaceae bacterium]
MRRIEYRCRIGGMNVYLCFLKKLFVEAVELSEVFPEELVRKAYELGFKYEKENKGCAQCVLAVVQDLFDLSEDVFVAGSALSGGCCLMGDGPCGAYSGALLALGYYYGRRRENFARIEDARPAAKLGRELRRKFEEEYGSIVCREIQKKIFGRSFFLLDPREYVEFEEAGAHVDKCTSVVGKAAAWLVEILLRNPVPGIIPPNR